MPNRSERQVDGLDLCSFFSLLHPPTTTSSLSLSLSVNRPIAQTHRTHHMYNQYSHLFLSFCLYGFFLFFPFINRPFCADIRDWRYRCSLSQSYVVTLTTLSLGGNRHTPRTRRSNARENVASRSRASRSLSGLSRREERDVPSTRDLILNFPLSSPFPIRHCKLSCVFEIRNKPLSLSHPPLLCGSLM